MCHLLLYQSDQNICFTYVLKFNTLFCISNIHFFNFSFSNLHFTVGEVDVDLRIV